MRDIILEYINDRNYQPSTILELMSALEISEEKIEEFNNEIDRLIVDYQIFLNKKKDRILSQRLANMYVGTINVRNDFSYGFIRSNFPVELYVSKGSLCGAFNGDEVLFSLIDKNSFGKSDEAIVQKVIKRATLYIVGTVVKENNIFCLEHNEKGFPKTIRLKSTNHVRAGHVVRCKITKYDRFMSEAEVLEVIGDATDIGMDITTVALSYDLRTEFPKEVIVEANGLDKKIINEKARRVDYTNKQIFTIDGKDAKDLDDAVSIEKLENGNYQLGVYIADVSFYVTEGSLLDKEAYLRGTSVYLADRVIPMLPVRLSNDLCSLNPNEEKLVLACIMEIDSEGNVISSEITEGIIKTIKRLNYDDCNVVLEKGRNAVEGYEVVYDSLIMMEELAIKLYEKKYNRGCLDFDIPEVKLKLDQSGKVIDIVPVDRGISEHIIEEFMIIANETVASFIEQMDLPFIYRVHAEPDKVKFHTLKNLVRTLGYQVKSLKPMELQKLLESIDEKHEYLKTLVLRLMAKAVYSEENIGHFGLASVSYTHFTSPIRRYPDLIVHRLLRKYLFNHDINACEFLELTNKIAEIAFNSSKAERNATECEMKVLDMKKAEYMADYIGDEFKGTISSVTKFGIFVTLENGVDGLVHVSNMDDDYYEYDDLTNSFYGRRTRKKLAMGNDVSVQLIRSDKKTSEIDFRLVYNNKRTTRNVKKGGKSSGKRKQKTNKRRQKGGRKK